MQGKEIINVYWIKQEKAINIMCSVQTNAKNSPSCHVSVLQRQWVSAPPPQITAVTDGLLLLYFMLQLGPTMQRDWLTIIFEITACHVILLTWTSND